MNSRFVNWLFLVITLLHFVLVAVFFFLGQYIELNIADDLLLSAASLWIPALIFLFVSGERLRVILPFRRIKIASVALIILFTFLTLPLSTFINSISMMFVDNAAVAMDIKALEMPPLLMFLIIGIIGPLGEELVFRGICYHGYLKNGTVIGAAVLSAVLFSLGHMNFNQAAYALVIGIILVLVQEACGSMWGNVIYHIVFNSWSFLLMLLMENLNPGALAENLEISREEIRAEIISYLPMQLSVVVFFTVLAGLVLYLIAKLERREERFVHILESRNDTHDKLITAPLIIAIVLAFIYMIAIAILQNLK